MKRPRLPRLPRPSSKTVEDVAVTSGFFGGLLLASIGVAMIYLPAGLIVAGVLSAGLTAVLARKPSRGSE